MAVADIGTARDVVLGTLKAAWDQASGSPVMLYEDNAADPPDTGSYGEAQIQHLRSSQVTIGERKRFRAWARLIVTIRTPYGDGLTTSDALVKIVQNAFEGKEVGGVTFRDVRPIEDGKDGNYSKTRVLVDFEYDRIK